LELLRGDRGLSRGPDGKTNTKEKRRRARGNCKPKQEQIAQASREKDHASRKSTEDSRERPDLAITKSERET
jgi:hypothetical protein